MSVQRMGFALAVLLLVGTSACKKTVEGERASWERNVQRVHELAVLYPGFGNPLEEQLARARQAMEAAGSAAEQERPAKMAEANRLLSGGFVGELGRLDGRVKALRAKATAALSGAKDETAREAARYAADAAGRVLAEVGEAAKRGAADAAAAATVMTRVRSDLEAAEKNLETVLQAQRKAAQEAQSASSPASPPTPPAAQPAVSQTWKCAYCGNTNVAAATACKGCGAPRSR